MQNELDRLCGILDGTALYTGQKPYTGPKPYTGQCNGPVGPDTWGGPTKRVKHGAPVHVGWTCPEPLTLLLLLESRNVTL